MRFVADETEKWAKVVKFSGAVAVVAAGPDVIC
jgi:hypothetical protein